MSNTLNYEQRAIVLHLRIRSVARVYATRTPTIGGFRNRFIVVRFLFVRRPHRHVVRRRSRSTTTRRANPPHGPTTARARTQYTQPRPLGARPISRRQSSGVNRTDRFDSVVVRVS